MSLRPADEEELLKDPQVEMTCQYCGARYVISHDELAAMFKQKET